jgi:hypothetical protein
VKLVQSEAGLADGLVGFADGMHVEGVGGDRHV